ncbi:MAG: hypothetical protein AAFQ37_11700, partial [Bacteroidota bacterium]
CNRRVKRANVSGMKTANLLSDGLPVAGGFIAGSMLNQLSFVQQNPILSAAAPIAGAIVTPMVLGKRSKMGKNLALGMAVAGVVNGIKVLAPSVAPLAGLSGVPYRSVLSPGVSGMPSVYVD